MRLVVLTTKVTTGIAMTSHGQDNIRPSQAQGVYGNIGPGALIIGIGVGAQYILELFLFGTPPTKI